jgi:hypothetical protein
MTEQPPAKPGRDPAKYVAIAIGVVVAAVGITVVLLPKQAPDIAYHVVSVQLGDPTAVVVTFQVEKAPLASAECQVTATGDNREIVNRLTGIRIGPSPGERVTTHTVTVPTGQPATGAAVAYCAITKTR